jgi:hypothetical protein
VPKTLESPCAPQVHRHRPTLSLSILGALLLIFGAGCGDGLTKVNPSDPLFPAADGEKFGYITKQGQWALPAKWDDAGPFSPEGAARARLGSLQGLISRNGAWLAEPKYEFLRDGAEGRFAFEEGGKVGFLDPTGKVVIQAKFDQAEDFLGGAAKVIVGGKAGLVRPDGEWLLPPKEEDLGSPGDGLIPIKREGRWGYIALDGAEAIETRFQNARRFSEGLAAVALDGRWGYIDKAGKWAIPPKYATASEVKGGFALVRAPGSSATVAVAPSGKVLTLPGNMTLVHGFSEERAWAGKAPRFSCLDARGRVLFAIDALSIEPFRQGLALGWKGDSMFYVDREGKVVWQEN